MSNQLLNNPLKIFDRIKYNYAIVLICTPGGQKYKDFLKFDAKNDCYKLYNNGRPVDISGLKINNSDIITFNKTNYLFLVKKSDNKYKKCEWDVKSGVIKGLDADIRNWEVENIAKEVDEFGAEKHWYDNPYVWMTAVVIGCVLLSFWFVGSYKEGGTLFQIMDMLKDLVGKVTTLVDNAKDIPGA
jgi:hypothetical protein